MAADTISQLRRSALEFMTTSDTRQVRWAFDHEAEDGTRWHVDYATVTEAISSPYMLEIQLTSADPLANPQTLLGVDALLTVYRADTYNQFAGIVTQVVMGPAPDPEMHRAWVRVEPAIKHLEQKIQSRVFQDMTVPEIVAEILNEELGAYGRELKQDALTAEYPKREYCVQHEESDLAFVSRLLESEGIWYRFEHQAIGGDDDALPVEVMHLHDDNTSIEPSVSASGDPLPISDRVTELGAAESIFRLGITLRTTSNAVHSRAYDWTRSSLTLESKQEQPDAHGNLRETYQSGDVELFRYDGTTYGGDDLEARATRTMERHLGGGASLQGEGVVAGMRPGLVFETESSSEYPGRFLITSVIHESEPASGAESRHDYHNRFTCIPAEVPFRPPLLTAGPRIYGVQSAMVVGTAEPDPSHRKTFFDKHGRIKVQFQWDRVGVRTERSSCFLRVSTPWAGAGYGVAFIPRVGMEVLVSFLNGDPDRPVVTGCVYNGEHPFPLTEDQGTQSLIRTQSETGAGYNELRFEDRDGQERIHLHAQKDLDEVVENNHTLSVGASETNSIGGSRTESVGSDETIDIGASRTETVADDESVTIGGARTESVGADETVTIGANQTLSIGSSQKVNIGSTAEEVVAAKKSIIVGGLFSEKVGGARSCTAVGAWSATAGASAALKASKHAQVKATKKITLDAGDDMVVKAGKKWSLDAGDDIAAKGAKKASIDIADEVTIKCGSATITLKKSGDVTIKGGKIKIDGSGNVTIKGSKVSIN